jgi:hypothetical protein
MMNGRNEQLQTLLEWINAYLADSCMTTTELLSNIVMTVLKIACGRGSNSQKKLSMYIYIYTYKMCSQICGLDETLP